MNVSVLGLVILAFVVTAASIKWLSALCVRFGLVDQPDQRKHHDGSIPLAGGLAMVSGIAIAMALSWRVLPAGAGGLAAGMLMLLVVGVLDDRFDLSARWRLLAQLAATLVLIYGADVSVQSLGYLFGRDQVVMLHSWAPLLTVVGVVGVVNAVNMIDGLDGLAGGIALIAFAWFAAVAALLGLTRHAVLAAIFMATVAGFLAFNLRHPWRARASVFMGDSGSMVLGFVLAWFAVTLTQHEGGHFAPMSAVWVLGLPLMDTLALMLRRIFQGRSPFSPDREHLHHALLRAGFSSESVVVILLGISAIFGAVGVYAWMVDVSSLVLFVGAWTVYFCYLALSMRAWYVMKWLKKLHVWANAVD